MAEWTGQDDDVVAAAMAVPSVFVKRRKTYIYAGFASTGARSTFKNAVANIPNIIVTDWTYPHDPALHVVRVLPA
jgi:hypothetical protein